MSNLKIGNWYRYGDGDEYFYIIKILSLDIKQDNTVGFYHDVSTQKSVAKFFYFNLGGAPYIFSPVQLGDLLKIDYKNPAITPYIKEILIWLAQGLRKEENGDLFA